MSLLAIEQPKRIACSAEWTLRLWLLDFDLWALHLIKKFIFQSKGKKGRVTVGGFSEKISKTDSIKFGHIHNQFLQAQKKRQKIQQQFDP